jgi:hypothetical protein
LTGGAHTISLQCEAPHSFPKPRRSSTRAFVRRH